MENQCNPNQSRNQSAAAQGREQAQNQQGANASSSTSPTKNEKPSSESSPAFAKTRKTAHSVYNLNYHIVFVTKYRNEVLTGAIEQHIKSLVPTLCKRYGWEQLALEVMPDHLHLFVSAPPTTAPFRITQTLKSLLANSVFATFPTLKQERFWGSGLWSDGCYYGSAGAVSASIIEKYIAAQKIRT